MTKAEQEIEAWFKNELFLLYGYPNPYRQCWGKDKEFREKEQALSDEYKRRHQVLIDARKREQSEQQRDADNIHVCERCTKKLPVRRGRPAKLCEECKNAEA